MPSKSKSQQRFFGMVHAYQNGELKGKDVSDSVKDAAKSMSKRAVSDFAETKHKGLPNHVKKNKKGKNKKKMKENKTRVFKISESQYSEIMALLEDKDPNTQVSVGLTNPSESDENPNNLSATLAKTERVAKSAGIQPQNANVEAEVNINGQEKEITVKSDKNESILLNKRQVDEMRIHNRNKHSKLIKVKDFIG